MGRGGIQAVAPITCPACKKVYKPYQFKTVFVEYENDWSLERASALMTKCCQAIVVKSERFDFIYWRTKGKYVRDLAIEHEGWKFLDTSIITDGPQIVTELGLPPLSGGQQANCVAEILYPEH